MFEDRSRVGDWQLDTIHAARGPAVVVSMTEHRSRLHLLVWSASHRKLIFFADPYAAWQRGSSENANGLTRQCLPRSLDFSTITDTQLRAIEDRRNHQPRKTLGYRSPFAVFAEGALNPLAIRAESADSFV